MEMSCFFRYYTLMLEQLELIINSNSSYKVKKLKKEVTKLKRYRKRYNNLMWSSFQTLSILNNQIEELLEHYPTLNGTNDAVSALKKYIMEVASSKIHYEMLSKLYEYLLSAKNSFDYLFEPFRNERAINSTVHDKISSIIDKQIELLITQFSPNCDENFCFNGDICFFDLTTIPELNKSKDDYYNYAIFDRIKQRYQSLKYYNIPLFKEKKEEAQSMLIFKYQIRENYFYIHYFDFNSLLYKKMKLSHKLFAKEIMNSQIN